MVKSFILALLFVSIASFADGSDAFSEVHQVVYGKDNRTYLVTNNGTWVVKKDKLVLVSKEQQTLAIDDYRHLFKKHNIKPSMWQNLTGLGYVILLFMFGVLYLYYQSALNRRRKAFYERIKLQQQVLSIAFLATGDEVLDCNISEQEVTRINQNAKLNLGEDIYFQSEKFISKLHPDDSSFFIGHFESLLSGGKNNYEITYRIAGEQEQWIWIVERGCVIERDSSGIATRLVASMRDIIAIKHDK